ncbi:Peptidyl-prolyl cis-trans isomerase pin4 [Epicoccum nigrum]|nr:Peptidyl-prolyl cis-trans isomerase pin4 [Epicoccum nigrum]
MAPRNKGKGKDSGDSKDAADGKSKLKPATSINVRHILCEKHSKKEEALEKIRNGTKFDEVAREMSEDKARQGTFNTIRELRGYHSCKLLIFRTGGSLGWKVRGSLMLDFEKVAYELEPSTTGAPKIGEVKTSEGYHIIMVEGRK